MNRPVAFGLNVDPSAGDPQTAARIAAIADESGLEYAGVQDHPYNPGFTDTLSHIAWLAARTSRVYFFTNVASLPLRPPALLAKQGATIDLLSGGRFELGLGAGAFWDGIAGMGGPRRSPGEGRQALSEAIDIIRASWAGQPFGYDGHYYQVPDLKPGPRPAHEIGIWLGVAGSRAVPLAGAKADGWSVSARPPAIGELAEGDADREARPAVLGLGLALAGLGLMVAGGWLAVGGAERVVHALRLGDSAVGLMLLALATTAELFALAWSAMRRGVAEIAVAGVVGSVAYNATASLGAAVIVRPLAVGGVFGPAIAAAVLPLGLVAAAPRGRLGRGAGAVLVAAYAAWVAVVLR